MDRLVARFEERLQDQFDPAALARMHGMAPDEMQGFGGVLRGSLVIPPETVTVRLVVEPWDTDERWTAMVEGRRVGEEAFWNAWLPDTPLCRIPFWVRQFVTLCSACGDQPCLHGAALTRHWLRRASERPELLVLFFNRRGLTRPQPLNSRAISRVPMALGTNLDRTRKELVAIVESALKAAGAARDNLFGGGESDEDSVHRD